MMEDLTKKEAGFVRDFVRTGNGVQSALNNYDTTSYKTASNIASTNLDKPRIQKAIKSIAEQISDEDLIKVHREGLSASSAIVKDGEIVERPDYSVRHKYLDSAYKLKGVYAPEKSVNLDVQVDILNPRALELAKKYEEELKGTLTENQNDTGPDINSQLDTE